MTNIISFLTDFGTTDTSVGQCKGVIAGIAPKASVIDLTHAVPHFDIATGSWLLRQAVPHFPPCVHVAVVDPGVGTARRPIAVECARGDVLIGPDNGLLLAAVEALGGVKTVVQLADPKFRHHPVSNTFHARDIFCPAAAHITHGVSIHMLGPTLDKATLVALPPPRVEVRDGVLHTAVASINEYGSLALTAPGTRLADLGSPARVRVSLEGRAFEARVVQTFGDAAQGETVLLVDSYGQLCLAINQGDLGATLALDRSARPALTIERPVHPTEVQPGDS
ncbi:MAG TPA: SAM-dependent chlorinase/fluorinase [Chloroflexota bacterium]|nr:SAM-dependent chlorinase/fluorinase [Chloroflexota bacterium]